MKKLLFVLLAGMLMLTGCGGGNDDKSGEAPKSNDESSTELSTKEVSAKLREINDWYVQISGMSVYVISGITLPAVLLRQERSWTSN